MTNLVGGSEGGFDPSPVMKRLSDPRKPHGQNDILGLVWADSKTLWSVEEGGRFVIWNVTGPQPRLQKEIFLEDLSQVWRLEPLLGMGFAGNSDLCAFELPSGRPLWSQEQESWVTAIAGGSLQLRGKGPKPILITGHDDGSLSLVRPKDGTLLFSIPGQAGQGSAPISAIAPSLCGKKIAVADEMRFIWIYDLEKGQWFEVSSPKDIVAHKNRIIGLDWYKGKDHSVNLFSSSWDGTVRIWKEGDRHPSMILNSHQGQVHSIGFASQGIGKNQRFLSSDEGSCLHLWDIETWGLIGLPIELSSPAKWIAVSPNGEAIAWADNSREIHLIPLESLEENSTESLGLDPADPRSLRNDLFLDSASKTLIHRQANGEIRIHSLESKNQKTLDLGEEKASALSLTSDCHWLWVALTDWNRESLGQLQPGTAFRILGMKKDKLENWQTEQVLESGIGPITSMSVSADGKKLALGSHLTDLVEIWNIPEGTPHRFLGDDWSGQTVQSLGWGKKSELAVGTIDPMATQGTPGNTCLWSETSCNVIDRLPARMMCWSPLKDILVRIDHLGRAWVNRFDSSDSQSVKLGESSGTWQAIAFSPGGECLALGSASHVALFDLKKDKWLGSVEVPCSVRAMWFEKSVEHLWVALKSDECILISLEPWLAEVGWNPAESKK